MRVVDELTEEQRRALQREEDLHETEREEEEEEEEVEEQAPLAVQRYGAVVHVIEELFARRDVEIEALTELSDDERQALSALQEVITGQRHSRFYFAEDRLRTLNETLAVLQPVLAVGCMAGTNVLRDSFEEMRERLNGLRQALLDKEFAEEEDMRVETKKKDDEGDDDDDDDDDDGDEDGAVDTDTAAPAEPEAPADETP